MVWEGQVVYPVSFHRLSFSTTIFNMRSYNPHKSYRIMRSNTSAVRKCVNMMQCSSKCQTTAPSMCLKISMYFWKVNILMQVLRQIFIVPFYPKAPVECILQFEWAPEVSLIDQIALCMKCVLISFNSRILFTKRVHFFLSTCCPWHYFWINVLHCC